MSTLIEKRAALMAQLKEKQAGLKAGEISDDDATAIKQLLDQVDQLDQQIGKAEDQAQMIAKIGALAAASTPTGNDSGGQNDDAPAKSAGDLFVKSYAKNVGTRLKAGYAVEFKANTDTQTVGDSTGAFAPYTVQTDTQAVFPYQRPLAVADLFSQGTMGASTNAVKYPVFGELEGSAGTVAEGGLKPQLHFPDPKWKADDLKEVAGWFAISDNMLDDLDWLRGEITDFAAYNIQLLEETQLLSGDGADNNIDGLFNREIQTLGQGADSDADRIFKCRKLIATATGFQPDGIVINPTDYEAIRLSKDANGSTSVAVSSPASTARAASCRIRRCGASRPWSPKLSHPAPRSSALSRPAARCCARAACASNPPTRMPTTSSMTRSPSASRNASPSR